MTRDTEDVVALRHELALISLEYAAKGLEREAGRVMRAINLIERQEAGRQSLSDRIDGLKGIVEAAYREGWVGGEESGRADIIDGIGWSADFGWERSEARAALHQEGIAPK